MSGARTWTFVFFRRYAIHPRAVADVCRVWRGAIAGYLWGAVAGKRLSARSDNVVAHGFFEPGDHFVPVEFPEYAQIAPGFGVNVADFNGDGHQDVFMAQNFFATQTETNRLDAGRGLLLLGDGSGGLVPIRGQESGIRVYGEQRGSAVSDFNGDGRPDLVVTQNGNRTRLFRNVRGKPGIRVRLKGDAGNPHAVGATVRLQFESGLGPVREVRTGSGYWSQDSSVLVFARAGDPSGIWVRWPGGEETKLSLPADAREVEISSDGTLHHVQ